MRLYEIADYTVDGVIIKQSNRTNTGFEGVTFSVNWRPTAPFVASAKNDEELFAATGTKSNTVHIGYFSDSREAAYAKSVFENSSIDEKIDMLNNGVDLAYPADLYTLPQHITLTAAQAQIAAHIAKNRKPRKPRVFDAVKADKLVNKIAGDHKTYRGINNDTGAEIVKAMETLFNGGTSYANALTEAAEPFKR